MIHICIGFCFAICARVLDKDISNLLSAKFVGSYFSCARGRLGGAFCRRGSSQGMLVW